MRIFWGVSLFVSVVAAACSNSGSDQMLPPRPNSELAAKAGVSLEEMGEGYWVFRRKCTECHAAQLPAGELEGQWHPIVEGMSGNAGLSAKEKVSLLNYVRAANLR